MWPDDDDDDGFMNNLSQLSAAVDNLSNHSNETDSEDERIVVDVAGPEVMEVPAPRDDGQETTEEVRAQLEEVEGTRRTIEFPGLGSMDIVEVRQVPVRQANVQASEPVPGTSREGLNQEELQDQEPVPGPSRERLRQEDQGGSDDRRRRRDLAAAAALARLAPPGEPQAPDQQNVLGDVIENNPNQNPQQNEQPNDLGGNVVIENHNQNQPENHNQPDNQNPVGGEGQDDQGQEGEDSSDDDDEEDDPERGPPRARRSTKPPIPAGENYRIIPGNKKGSKLIVFRSRWMYILDRCDVSGTEPVWYCKCKYQNACRARCTIRYMNQGPYRKGVLKRKVEDDDDHECIANEADAHRLINAHEAISRMKSRARKEASSYQVIVFLLNLFYS